MERDALAAQHGDHVAEHEATGGEDHHRLPLLGVLHGGVDDRHDVPGVAVDGHDLPLVVAGLVVHGVAVARLLDPAGRDRVDGARDAVALGEVVVVLGGDAWIEEGASRRTAPAIDGLIPVASEDGVLCPGRPGADEVQLQHATVLGLVDHEDGRLSRRDGHRFEGILDQPGEVHEALAGHPVLPPALEGRHVLAPRCSRRSVVPVDLGQRHEVVALGALLDPPQLGVVDRRLGPGQAEERLGLVPRGGLSLGDGRSPEGAEGESVQGAHVLARDGEVAARDLGGGGLGQRADDDVGRPEPLSSSGHPHIGQGSGLPRPGRSVQSVLGHATHLLIR